MSTLTVYPDASSGGTTVDGAVGIDNGILRTWTQIRGDSGNFANKTGATNQMYYAIGDTLPDTFNTLARGIYTYDTSPLGAGANISSSTISFYGSGVRTDAASPGVQIVASTPAANNNLQASDFGQLGSTPFSTRILASGFSTSGYNDFVLNANGLANISKTGVSRFGTIESEYDLTGTDPGTLTNGGLFKAECYQADNAGTDKDPKLVITYTVASGPTNAKTWNGLAIASVKNRDGLALASNKNWDGIT